MTSPEVLGHQSPASWTWVGQIVSFQLEAVALDINRFSQNSTYPFIKSTQQDLYGLPLAPLNEFPEPWCWKMSGRGIERTYRVVFLTGPPLNFLSTGSHANWPGISRSVSSHKGILYLENLGGVQLKKPPCTIFSGLNKNRVPDMGEKWFEKKQSSRTSGTLFFFKAWRKQSPRNSWTISPLCIFQTTKNGKFSLYPFLTFFSTRVLETHSGGLKAACTGPALGLRSCIPKIKFI